MDNNIIASRIKELRTSLELTQSDFAESINTTQAALSGYERGDRVPSIDILICISEKYNVSIDWLCGTSDQKLLSSEIVMYTDLIKLIIQIDELQDLTSTIHVETKEEGWFESDNFLDTLKYKTLSICLDDQTIIDFFQEWTDIKAVVSKSPIGQKLYDIWLKDIYERFNFEIKFNKTERIDSRGNSSESLPFNF